MALRNRNTPSSNNRAWDRHYLYNPQTMAKVIEVYRFVHNWMGDHKTKKTPAIRLVLARGKTYSPEIETTAEEALRRLHHLL